jgi:O-antigen/teichoic acid export membrane protein
MVTDPLIVLQGSGNGMADPSAAAVMLSILLGCVVGSAYVLIGHLVRGSAYGLAVFGPWIPAAMLQDQWRYLSFKEGRGRHAALNDATWAVAMSAALPLGLIFRTVGWQVAVWGVGAAAGAIVGFVQLRVRPGTVTETIRWWRRDAWRLAKWLGLDRIATMAGGQGAILLLAAILRSADLGGLRAVQSVFAPLTLIGPAVVLPGLPAVRVAQAKSLRAGKRTAGRLSVIAVGLAVGYVVLLAPVRRTALGAVFGAAFERYAYLLFPVAVAQVAISLGAGPVLLLKARMRMQELVLGSFLGSAAGLIGAWLLGSAYGLGGAAWALAFGATLSMVIVTWFAVVETERPLGAVTEVSNELRS